MAKQQKILIVDDEDGLRTLLRSELESSGYSVEEADGGNMALEMVERTTYDVIILDIRMPDVDGLSVLRDIRSKKIPSKVVMLTGVGELKVAKESVALGADDFLSKPIEFRNLLACLKRVAS